MCDKVGVCQLCGPDIGTQGRCIVVAILNTDGSLRGYNSLILCSHHAELPFVLRIEEDNGVVRYLYQGKEHSELQHRLYLARRGPNPHPRPPA